MLRLYLTNWIALRRLPQALGPGIQFGRRPLRRLGSALLAIALGCSWGAVPAHSTPQTSHHLDATIGSGAGTGTPYTADQLARLLPATVYFQGRTAPVQLRNAGGASLAGGGIVWAGLVDTAGYASSVQEKYQFYLVTEGALEIGGKRLPAGAYGGGFVGERFVIMDLGGHTVAEGTSERDAALTRPRPLQVMADAPDAVKLFLGRRWVLLRAAAGTGGS